MYWLMVCLQILIVILVGWTGIYFEWTKNGLVLGLLGVAAAWLLTVAPLEIYLWLRRLLSRRFSGQQGPNHDIP